tara:strand:- start:735 stop:2567 length:1833 start_codon:yes stop_codon:yes gene_type:complete
MCGIIACLSININTANTCLKGLVQLQNRGYDSAGICSIINHKFINTKYASDNESALIKIELEKINHNFSNISIGHTRWATHGPKTDINSHPHISSDGIFSVVHNGIIENYLELKNMLIENEFTFKSQTDTEVIANLLAYFYNLCNKDITNTIQKTINKMQGTWGLVIMCIDTPDNLYAVRHGSPILISHDNEYCIITSEQSGFCNMTNNYFVLNNNDICIITRKNNELSILTKDMYEFKDVYTKKMALTPDPYPHWTIKEINEQPESCLRAISLGARLLSNNKVKLGGLSDYKNILININHIILLGCGTSYNAGVFGMNYMKEMCDFHTVQLFDAGEFCKQDIPKNGKTALILLSQSGETKDLHRCIEIGKNNNLFLIGVVNVVDSLIAREVNCGCYLNAGREVGIASTKSYTSQIIILNMIAIWFAQIKNINNDKRIDYIVHLRSLHMDIKKTLEMCDKNIDKLVPFFQNQSCFILGKEKCESIAREGALKIKELSYIHAEGYNTSSLKHGPFALLKKNYPVILIAPENKYYAKNENAYEEIKSRHATIIYITDKRQVNKDNVIQIPKNKCFCDFLSIIPLQILAYKLSLTRKINPDMPRNLAKVVTVE